MVDREVSWTKLFTFDLPVRQPAKVERECCDACKEAREIKCVCACGGKNHGAANRQGMEPLDKALGLEKEAPKPLGDLALDLELSGRLEVP
jgi:hypothetical protein